MTPPDPMDRLPELPSELPAESAGFWAGAVLMQAATKRQWPREQLRMQMFVMLAGLAGAASDETLHAELQAALDVSRAHLAGKQ